MLLIIHCLILLKIRRDINFSLQDLLFVLFCIWKVFVRFFISFFSFLQNLVDSVKYCSDMFSFNGLRYPRRKIVRTNTVGPPYFLCSYVGMWLSVITVKCLSVFINIHLIQIDSLLNSCLSRVFFFSLWKCRYLNSLFPDVYSIVTYTIFILHFIYI